MADIIGQEQYNSCHSAKYEVACLHSACGPIMPMNLLLKSMYILF